MLDMEVKKILLRLDEKEVTHLIKYTMFDKV